MYNSGELTERGGFESTVSQPLTSIGDAASPELLEQLTVILTNYRNQLQSLEESELSPLASKDPPGVPKSEVSRNPILNTSDGAQSNVVSPEHGVMNLTLEPLDARDLKSTDKDKAVVTLDTGSNELPARRAHNPKVESKGNVWDRIRVLASQFDASAVEPFSPKALITKTGQRLRVDDGVTAPLR